MLNGGGLPSHREPKWPRRWISPPTNSITLLVRPANALITQTNNFTEFGGDHCEPTRQCCNAGFQILSAGLHHPRRD